MASKFQIVKVKTCGAVSKTYAVTSREVTEFGIDTSRNQYGLVSSTYLRVDVAVFLDTPEVELYCAPNRCARQQGMAGPLRHPALVVTHPHPRLRPN